MILNKQAGRTDKAKAKEFAHIFFSYILASYP